MGTKAKNSRKFKFDGGHAAISSKELARANITFLIVLLCTSFLFILFEAAIIKYKSLKIYQTRLIKDIYP
jgi:hypothetical protein